MVHTKKRVAFKHRKAVLELYAGGYSIERIARISGHRPQTIEVMLRRSGIAVDEQRRTRPKELNEMNEKKRPITRGEWEKFKAEAEDFLAGRNHNGAEEPSEADRTLELACAQEFYYLVTEGYVDRLSRRKNIPYQDAYRELYREAFEPLAERQQSRVERAARDAEGAVARALGEGTHEQHLAEEATERDRAVSRALGEEEL